MDNEVVTLSILTTMVISLVIMGSYFPNHQLTSTLGRPPVQTIVKSAHNVAFEPAIRRVVPMMAPTFVAPVRKSSLASSFATLRTSDILLGLLGLLMFAWLVVRLLPEEWHSNLTSMLDGISDPDQWNVSYDERMMPRRRENHGGVFTVPLSSEANQQTGFSTPYWCKEISLGNESLRRLVKNSINASQQFMRHTGQVPTWPAFSTADLVMILNGQFPSFQEILDLRQSLTNTEAIKEQQTALVRHLENQVSKLTASVKENDKTIEASIRRLRKLEDGLRREKDSHSRLQRTARFLFAGICVKALALLNLRSENRQQAATIESLNAECAHIKASVGFQESALEKAKSSLLSMEKAHQVQVNFLGISQNDLQSARKDISRLELDLKAKASALLSAQNRIVEEEALSARQSEKLSAESARLAELQAQCEAKEHEFLAQQRRLEQLSTAMDAKDRELQAKDKLFEDQRAQFNVASGKNRNAFLVRDARYESNCWRDALREFASVNKEAHDVFTATENSIQVYRSLDNAARYSHALAKSQEHKAKKLAQPSVGASSTQPIGATTSGSNTKSDPISPSPTTKVDDNVAQLTSAESPRVKLPPRMITSGSTVAGQSPLTRLTSTEEQPSESSLMAGQGPNKVSRLQIDDAGTPSSTTSPTESPSVEPLLSASQPGGDGSVASPSSADQKAGGAITPSVVVEPTSTAAERPPGWRKEGKKAVKSGPLTGGISQSRWAHY